MAAPRTRKCPICYRPRKAGNGDDAEHRQSKAHREASARMAAIIESRKAK